MTALQSADRRGPAIWFLVVLSLLATCTTPCQEAGDPDTRFRIFLFLQDSSPPGIWGEVRTTSLYPCIGYKLRFGISRSADTLSLTIVGMLRPSPCIQGMEEAQGRTYLAPPGERSFILRIRYRASTDLYRVTLTKTGLESTLITSRFTFLHLRHR